MKRRGQTQHARLMDGYIEFNPITKLLQDLERMPAYQAVKAGRNLPTRNKLNELRDIDRKKFYELNL